jgi:hypothetical protein
MFSPPFSTHFEEPVIIREFRRDPFADQILQRLRYALSRSGQPTATCLEVGRYGTHPCVARQDHASDPPRFIAGKVKDAVGDTKAEPSKCEAE